MTDAAAGPAPDAQEPSMEDILASIRRILSEDEAGKDAEDDPQPASRARPARTLDEDELEPEAPARPAKFAYDPEEEAAARDPAALAADLFDAPQAPATRPPPPEHQLEDDEDVLLLTPAMRARDRKIVSADAAETSTDVLSQLARAILDRRDVVVSNREVTLEEMVRGMLRPLLREWLDRNLPYLIERLVKKEIDLMVNRAERLED